MQSLLTGVRVLDLTSLLPGPFCSLLLADMGAEVIKVERIGAGDGMRASGPDAAQGAAGDSAGFEALNRNKQSIALDLKHSDGKLIFTQLTRTADVVLEGFRPGVMARLGLDYDTLAIDNTSLVYCSLSGYGQDGPLVQRAGHDINYLALAGVLGLTGQAGGPPLVAGVQVADMTGALLAALGIVSALLARDATGQGRTVDVSMFDGALALLTMTVANWMAEGKQPERGQMLLSGRYPCYGVYETADGRYMSLGALEPKFWISFCEGVGREDLIPLQYDDSKQTSDAVAAVFRSKDYDEWLALAPGLDACCEPVLTLEETLAQPHTEERKMLLQSPSPQLGAPLKFGGMSHQADLPAPRLGQHSMALLEELGYSSDECEALLEAGVVGASIAGAKEQV